MFFIYINDIIRSFLTLKFNLYADDTGVCLSGNNLNALFENLNGELSKVSIWFRANRLTLNSTKSQSLNFQIRQRVIPVNVHIIVIIYDVIARVETIKLLCVYFVWNVTWKTHILLVCRRMFRFLPLVRKCRNVFVSFPFRFLYNASGVPNIDLLHNCMGKCCKYPLESIENSPKMYKSTYF